MTPANSALALRSRPIRRCGVVAVRVAANACWRVRATPVALVAALFWTTSVRVPTAFGVQSVRTCAIAPPVVLLLHVMRSLESVCAHVGRSMLHSVWVTPPTLSVPVALLTRPLALAMISPSSTVLQTTVQAAERVVTCRAASSLGMAARGMTPTWPTIPPRARVEVAGTRRPAIWRARVLTLPLAREWPVVVMVSATRSLATVLAPLASLKILIPAVALLRRTLCARQGALLIVTRELGENHVLVWGS